MSPRRPTAAVDDVGDAKLVHVWLSGREDGSNDPQYTTCIYLKFSSSRLRFSLISAYPRVGLTVRPDRWLLLHQSTTTMKPNNASDAAEVGTLVPLSPMDAVLLSYGFAVIYVFPAPASSSEDFNVQKLENAFRDLVNEDYRVFIGQVQVDNATGRVSVLQTLAAQRRGAAGLRFEQQPKNSLTSDEVVQSLEWSFMPSKLEKNETIAIRCTPLADGGVSIGITLNHTLMDGEGLFTLVRAWGQRYSGVVKEDRLVINHDRHLLSGTGRGSQRPHPAIRIVPPPSGQTISISQLPATTQHAFHVSRKNMLKLKALASTSASDKSAADPPFVSTIDIITALFVVLISRARGHGQDVRITTGVNARQRLDPPLPTNYAGNCVFSALSAYSKEELQPETDRDDAGINPATLIKLARRVRASILELDSEFLRDSIEFIAQQEHLSRVAVSTKYILGPDLMFTSWANMGLYDAEFNNTRPCYAGIAKVPFLDGMVVIAEAAKGIDGLDVLVFLECAAMQRLKVLCEQVSHLQD